MGIKFYIMSRGKAPDQDYKWIRLAHEEARIEQPPDLSKGQIDQLVYRQDFSLFIGYYQQHLVLQVTGLPTGKWQDYQQRSVRNSLLCIGVPGDELIFRRIAIAALEKQLEAVFDKTIDFAAAEPGFTARPELLKFLREGLSNTNSYQNQASVSLPRQIGKNTLERRLLIAKQLKEYCLHIQEGPLVVITNSISRETFESRHVWLGLSDLIDDDIEDEHPPKPVPFIASHTINPSTSMRSGLGILLNIQRLLQARISLAQGIIVAVVLLFVSSLLTVIATSHTVDIKSVRATAFVQAQAANRVQATQIAAKATVQMQLQLTATAISQPLADNVKFLYTSPKPSVHNGRTIALYIAVQNTGQSTWSSKQDYHLVCVDSLDPDCQEAKANFSMLKDQTIPPEGTYVFTIIIKAHFAKTTVKDQTAHNFDVSLAHGQQQFGPKQTLSYFVTP